MLWQTQWQCNRTLIEWESITDHIMIELLLHQNHMNADHNSSAIFWQKANQIDFPQGKGYFKEGVILKKGESIIFLLTNPFSVIFLYMFGVSVCVCVCVCVFVCVCVCVLIYTISISIICVSQGDPSITAFNQQIIWLLQVNNFWKKRHCEK